MEVANIELCKKLYELSGWETGYWLHNWPKTDGSTEYVVIKDGEQWMDEETAQQVAKESLEAIYEKAPKTIYSFSTDDLSIEIGDAEEAK